MVEQVRRSADTASDYPKTVNMKSIARPSRIVAFISISILATILAFVSGWFVRSSQDLVASSDAPIRVDGSVETRQFGEGLAVEAQVEAGRQFTVAGLDASQSALPVVTNVAVSTSDRVGNRVLLGAVSNRPVWLLTMDIPPYRDVHRGESGPDVASFQRAMEIQETGKFDLRTQRALETMYASVGFDPAGGRGSAAYIRMAEIVAVSGDASVQQVAALGSVLGPDAPLAVLRVGAPIVNFRATVAEADLLSVGMQVQVKGAEGGVTTAAVQFVSQFSAADSTGDAPFAGHDVTLEVSIDQVPADVAPGKAVTISSQQAANSDLLAVPELAIREDARGEYVLVIDAATDADSTRRVDVDVEAREDGWAGLAPLEALSPGLTVRLQP